MTALLSFHRFANLFPLIEGQEFYDLAEDIRENGLRDRIDLLGDAILDGRNRYRALVWLATTGEVLGPGWGEGSEWEALGLEGQALSASALAPDSWLFYPFNEATQGDPLDYVLSKNLNRRHLTDDQRRIVAAELVTMGKGRPGKMPQSAGFSRDHAAAALGTDVAGVERARTVVKRAVPEVVEAVKSGDLSVAAAAEIATQPVERQAEIAKALTRDASGRLTDEAKKALAPLIREIRVEKIAAKKERRAEREQAFGRKVQALPGSFYGVAIEDFEWHHAAWSEETGSEKSPSMHYETAADAQTPEAIVARCAERFACLAPDCILFKWVTIPHLAIGIKVLELQGFEYVTSLVWNKERAGAARGPGYWVTGEHEVVLVGKRGNVVPPATAHFRSNFSAPVGEHSEKPDNLHEIVEFHWPTTPKVEFNARRRRDGWAAWGFDAPDSVPAAEVEARRAAFVAYREAQDEARLWQHPAIADRHVLKMTRDYEGDVSFDVATCQCGWSFRCEGAPFDLARDQACDAHWREVIAQNSQLPGPSGETETAAAEATDGASAAAAVAGLERAPYDAGDVVTIEQLAGSDWLAPAELDALELTEREQLKILSDFCHPQRTLCDVLGPHWQAREMAYLGSGGQWSLRGAGWDRLRELEAAERQVAVADLTEAYRAPQPSLFDVARQLDDAPQAEVVDGVLQTRLPIDGDELAEQLALLEIDAGRAIEPEMLRHLVGKSFAHCGLTKISVTDDGRAFLAQLVSPASVQQQGATP
ncbi:MT-A70 family methyltransferase [Bradyrhizobium sp. 153]|uniref:MT-A70 family methyltransferase n=1 Tax=Bradyrhizobium sp. 153 TaxID=2782627 RepID=UPI001FFC190D|nr:MT-A70 family methyltransferase [Bradyrhizobium sp. 153]